ncbi:MAG: hypothetical protein WC655_29020 [Candidatus Hydrogenedentales bacterium]|jgi:Na+/H+ antiporter NhaD/arsenite permease-like protein
MHYSKSIQVAIGLYMILAILLTLWLGGNADGDTKILGIGAEFYLFAITLVGVALFHHHTLYVALTGLVTLLAMKLTYVTDFSLLHHLERESMILLNLLGLLLGFAVLAKHFEESNVPELLPRFLPNDWRGGFALLVIIFILSNFLDNIAAAMIGGTVALIVFKKRLDTGYLAGIVAASNAGGAGSVLGDTTTTMMWIDGVPALSLLPALAASVPALCIFGVITSIKQQRFSPIVCDALDPKPTKWGRLAAVGMILVGAILTNFLLDFPAAGVWGAILLAAIFVKTPWSEIPGALKGSLFLLSLVLCASMMPVEELPSASWQTAFVLGAVSAVFDNIPLTKLALDQGGYDWAFLAYAVGFGGSMVWFGSSAGVALSNMFPQAKSVGAWVKHGWSVPLAYVVGFLIMLYTVGWNPHEPHRPEHQTSPAATAHVLE